MTRISDWAELRDIEWQVRQDGRTMKVETIITADTETSSGLLDPDTLIVNSVSNGLVCKQWVPISCMYIWQFAIETAVDIKVFIGRTWEQFEDFMQHLTRAVIDRIGAKPSSLELRVYVHNLGFDWQHFRNVYDYEFTRRGKYRAAVFARSARKPMKAQIKVNGVKVTMIDTLCLTQKGLDAWTKDSNLPVKKLSTPPGYYEVLRTPNTDLTEFDIDYATTDVIAMVYGVRQYREKYHSLYNIPLTQTGEVRRTCKANVTDVTPAWAALQYDTIQRTDLPMYRRLVQTFCGGWVHANATKVNRVIKNVRAFDFASSYPFVMCAFSFPVTAFEQVDASEFNELVKLDPRALTCPKHWLMRAKFTGLTAKLQNTYWSSSKTLNTDKEMREWTVDNGKIATADEAEMFITDLDYLTFTWAYDWEDVEIVELYVAEATPLPTSLVVTILDYYSKKTTLKGTGEDSKYKEAKQFTNSIYGVSVTKLFADDVAFELTEDGPAWVKHELTEDAYYEKRARFKPEDAFLAFQIGVWVTAFARSNLWYILHQVDKHAIYGDTDSLKGTFDDKDMVVINAYNEWVLKRQQESADLHKFDVSKFRPLKKSGKPDILGYFDEEDLCHEFKTLGAKRYIDTVAEPVDSFDEIVPHGDAFKGRKGTKWVKILSKTESTAYVLHCTIAGLPKKAAEMALNSMEEFNENRYFGIHESGKRLAMYNDNQPPATWIDYQGKSYHSTAKYGVCIVPTTFDLSIGGDYMKYLNKLHEETEIPEIFSVTA